MPQEVISKSSQVFFISQSERKNARFQRYMEDAHTIIPRLGGDENTFFAAVYDGHGGKETAIYVSNHLHLNLLKAMESEALTTMKQRLEYAFYLTDVESKNEDMKNSGCTGVCVTILNEDGKRMLYSANAGDSRSVLYTDGSTIRMSFDHKATDPDEEKRVVSLGGFVMKQRVLGILAISRSFGDHSCKQYITAEPYVRSIELTKDSEFLVLACDGVFDVLSDEDVTQIVKEEVSNGNIENCAEKLIQEAVDRGSTDNITAVVIGLKPTNEWSPVSCVCNKQVKVASG